MFFLSAAWVSWKKDSEGTVNLGLAICLSLWAYYIQMKGEFTDRLQHPYPIRRFPQGSHVVHTYVASASQHDTTLSSRSPPLLQSAALWVNTGRCLSTRLWTLVKYVMVFIMLAEYK